VQHTHRRPGRHILRCTLCGQEITEGEEYWACNGSRVCTACFAEFARQELRACHETRGKETRQ
jgi:hypothetical protein